VYVTAVECGAFSFARKSLTETIKSGFPEPKGHPGAIPPTGGVTPSREELNAVAA
jgi:hypothetical protein